MSKTRTDIKDDKNHSDTLGIQDQLQIKLSPTFQVTIEEDTFDGFGKMCEYRNEEIQRIGNDALLIKEMFQDFSELVAGQQPDIEQVATTLRSAKKHVEKAEENLLEVEQGRKCVVS